MSCVSDAVRLREPRTRACGALGPQWSDHRQSRLWWGDRYGGEWPRQRFQADGISYRPSEMAKSEIYCEWLPLLNRHQVELLDHVRMRTQLCELERRTARGGRDSVDPAAGGHDDVANAVAGAVCLTKLGPSQHRQVCPE